MRPLGEAVPRSGERQGVPAGYDGDFQLSHLEEQAFIAARRPPMFDGALVEGAVFSDLDPELVGSYVQSRAARTRPGHLVP